MPVPTQFAFAGRSMHRWLVGIPVVLYLTTCVLFAAHMAHGGQEYLRAGMITNLVAVLSAVLAAGFGFADFLQIPSEHPAKRPAMIHGGLNSTALVLVASNLFAHNALLLEVGHDRRVLTAGFDSTLALALTCVAVGLTLVSGAIGFWMAHHQHVGGVPIQRSGRLF